MTPVSPEPASVVALRQLAAEAAERRLVGRRSARAHRRAVEPDAGDGQHDREEDLRRADAALAAGEPGR